LQFAQGFDWWMEKIRNLYSEVTKEYEIKPTNLAQIGESLWKKLSLGREVCNRYHNVDWVNGIPQSRIKDEC